MTNCFRKSIGLFGVVLLITGVAPAQTAPAAEGPAEYSVSAAGASGELSCRIVVDGVVLAEETAGDYGAISCAGRL